MQSSYLLLPRTSSDAGGGGGGSGGILLSQRKPVPFPASWTFSCRRRRQPLPPPAVVGGGEEQDHYAVLGIPRGASASDVKRAYRLLARKYHPDVNRDLQATEVFKSICAAYEVLSDEVKRVKYDRTLIFQGTSDKWRWRWPSHLESEELRQRMLRWEELRQRMRYQKHKKESSWYNKRDRFCEASDYRRGPFEVLWFALMTLSCMQIFGCRASLSLCGLAALLDNDLDAGYKTGYVVAWFLGGRGGILLSLCINFISGLCGKKSSSLVVVGVLAMWVGAILAKLVPIPHGAVLALLYMSIKLQTDLQ